MNTKYRLHQRYQNAYKTLEDALIDWTIEHDMPELNPIEAAQGFIESVDSTFSHIPNGQQRIAECLQGLGLGIPYTNYDILKLAESDGFYDPDTDRPSKKFRILDNYWNFMAMRIIHISKGRVINENP